MIKEIILLLGGGAITFAFTLLYNRISKCKPSMVWVALPPVHFPKEGLAALQIIIANEGDAAATNVRTIVTLDKGAHFDSVEVHLSEIALVHTLPSLDPLEVLLPRVPSQSSISLSCIIRCTSEPVPHISIIGDDDIIGTEQERPSVERENQMRKKTRKYYWLLNSLMLILVFSMYMWTYVVTVAIKAEQQQIAIVDLYIKQGEYNTARKLLSEIGTPWYLPPGSVIYIKMASIAAAQGKGEVAIEFLSQVPKEKWNAVELLLTDTAFDSVRGLPKFKELMMAKEK